MAPFCENNRFKPILHEVDEAINVADVHRNRCSHQNHTQLLQSLLHSLQHPNTSPLHVPDEFYEIQVWGLRWPVYALDSMVLQELCRYRCSVGSGFIIHENVIYFSNFYVRYHGSYKEFIPVPQICHCSSWDHVKTSTVFIDDATRRHDAAFPITVMFHGTEIRKSLAFPPIDSHTSFIIAARESAFICKQNSATFLLGPSYMPPSPVQTDYSVSKGEWDA